MNACYSVYAVQEVPILGENETLSPIKIGFSSNVKVRVCAIGSGSPRDLKVIACLEKAQSRDEAMSLEKQLHRVFSDHRIKGEWFSGAIKEKVVSILDAWNGQYPSPEIFGPKI